VPLSGERTWKVENAAAGEITAPAVEEKRNPRFVMMNAD
jgi:hypothetical protein